MTKSLNQWRNHIAQIRILAELLNTYLWVSRLCSACCTFSYLISRRSWLRKEKIIAESLVFSPQTNICQKNFSSSNIQNHSRAGLVSELYCCACPGYARLPYFCIHFIQPDGPFPKAVSHLPDAPGCLTPSTKFTAKSWRDDTSSLAA